MKLMTVSPKFASVLAAANDELLERPAATLRENSPNFRNGYPECGTTTSNVLLIQASV